MVNGIVSSHVSKKEKINILNLQKKFYFNIDLHGFFFSRLIYLFTLIVSYKKLKTLLKKINQIF